MLNRMVPKKVFFTSGVGRHSEYLESFEMALRDARVDKFNLVTVSSILPPNCEIINREEGLKLLSPGQIVFAVLSRNSSNENNRVISTAIGCAIPRDKNKHGYLSEHHAFGETKEVTGKYAEKLAESMYYTSTGDKDIKTMNIARSAIVKKDLTWTTVISAAIFIL
ncbi:MAG TPA: arginine decarboxylase, pyruvoyl-dependent [Methanosarcinales archaeon]|nr:arginine decarboxylase, pyruvoyl-dependent [Methanosarcinales archaeon]